MFIISLNVAMFSTTIGHLMCMCRNGHKTTSSLKSERRFEFFMLSFLHDKKF